MPTILDNINTFLNAELRRSLEGANWADFCIGYFNLRGWRHISDAIDNLPVAGEDPAISSQRPPCRLLIGMQRAPLDELRAALRFGEENDMDNRRAGQLLERLVREFRQQISIGTPTNEDEAGLLHLAQQLQSGRLRVKLFLRHPLHAKLYLVNRPRDYHSRLGYLGSSNLTMAGLAAQGELNVDVNDPDATKKLAEWFKARWEDDYAVDITDRLIEILLESWIIPVTPYEIYVKMAYHLSGLNRHATSVGLAD